MKEESRGCRIVQGNSHFLLNSQEGAASQSIHICVLDENPHPHLNALQSAQLIETHVCGI